jgi:hypothetical protein
MNNEIVDYVYPEEWKKILGEKNVEMTLEKIMGITPETFLFKIRDGKDGEPDETIDISNWLFEYKPREDSVQNEIIYKTFPQLILSLKFNHETGSIKKKLDDQKST